jgi:hypothetical protein
MEDYEGMSTSEVQRLAKEGDKNALFEMVWRLELLPAEDRNNPIEQCAWQDYWFEKAADAGHIIAKSRYANSLINRIMNAEDRQKAMSLFESLAADFDAGKLSNNEQEYGIVAKLWLGVMLCEGYHTWRDAKTGAELIQAAHTLTHGFENFGFTSLSKIGRLYSEGLAQPYEEPSIADLEKATKYLDAAIMRFNPERDDPNNHGYLQFTRNLLEITERRIETKMELKATRGYEDLNFPGATERRKKMMELSDMMRQRLAADKAALKRLRERLAKEGWESINNLKGGVE